jgi:predicted site-specific integrase-resolvase
MNENTTPQWVRGIEGLASVLQVSVSTAKRIKKRGSIRKAIHQEGRTILVNAPLALELFGAQQGKHF